MQTTNSLKSSPHTPSPLVLPSPPQQTVTQKETKVRLKPIKPETNLQKLAGDIIAKCKYISDKKYSVVEQVRLRRGWGGSEEKAAATSEASLKGGTFHTVRSLLRFAPHAVHF